MATATVGAFAGTSSQRTVSTVKPSCTHALFGTIDSLEKNKAIVNYGAFTTQVNLELLELVKPAKKEK